MGHAQYPAVPTIFGRYQTLFRIASGGMAEVYAARVRGEAGFQKLVALKRMLPHLTDDERFVNMFMDEGKLAANIESPNVVSTLDLGRADDGSLYLVMELVVGTTLSTLLRNAAKDGQSCPIDVACEILAQAAQGLHDAHEAKTPFGAPLQLVHRDISPQNILVGVDGRVRITDFGVARAVLRRTKTSTGEFKGKLSYFSPEQCADKNLDRRSDLFSLGVVAWETLTTRRLFHAENPLAVLERVTRMPIPSPHEVRPEVPESVAAVVTKALERDRDERFDTALEFGQALRAAARDAVGPGDRSRVTLLVQSYGGDQLERVQAQLKESLTNASAAALEESIEAPDEASGIVLRPDEATKSSASHPAFEAPPDAPTAQPEPQRRAPLYVAVVVAVLGLGGGAAIGFMAGGEDPATDATPAFEADEGPTAPAPEDPDTVAGAVTPDDGSSGDGDEGDEADLDGDDDTALTDESVATDDVEPATPARRGAAARRRAQERARRQADALAQRQAELRRQEEARRQREQARQREEQDRRDEQQQQQRGNHLLASPDDFMREVQQN